MTQTARPAPAIYALTIERFRGITSLKWKPSCAVNAIIGGSGLPSVAIPVFWAGPPIRSALSQPLDPIGEQSDDWQEEQSRP